MKFPLPLAALAGLLLGGCAHVSPTAATKVPEKVDLRKYSGRWYEIAAYPNWFQRRCAGGTTAEYIPRPDGGVQVINRSFDKRGKLIRVEGIAHVVKNSGNTRLKVNFGGPFAGDYHILAFDGDNYSWALVGHPSKQFLWVLARQPQIAEPLYAQIAEEARRLGYNPDRLRRTDQTRYLSPRPEITPSE